MKPVAVFFISILVFISCTSKKAGTENAENEPDGIDSIINDVNMEKDYVEKKDTISEEYFLLNLQKMGFRMMETTQVTKEFERLNVEAIDQGRHKRLLNSGIEITIDKDNYNITYEESHPDSHFSIYKVYNLNGNIMHKNLVINVSGFPIGMYYEYNEFGNLIMEENLDKPYKFTFNEVLAFCKKEGIKTGNGREYPYTGIRHYQEEDGKYAGKYVWSVEYYIKNCRATVTIILDGNTGKVLSRETNLITNCMKPII